MSVARPRRGRMGGSRRRRPPAAVEESIEIHTSDGVALRASALPRSEGAPAAGTAVLAHAMFARRGEFVKPAGRSLADLLRSSGFDVVAFDFRGHGTLRIGDRGRRGLRPGLRRTTHGHENASSMLRRFRRGQQA